MPSVVTPTHQNLKIDHEEQTTLGLKELSAIVGIICFILSLPVCFAVTRLYYKSLNNNIFRSTVTNKSNLMFLMAIAIISNGLYTANISFLFNSTNSKMVFIPALNKTGYKMTTECKAQGALTQITLQTNVVSLLCITYEVYSTFSQNNKPADAEIRFKRYLQILFFPLLFVLVYLSMVQSVEDQKYGYGHETTGFSPSMMKSSYLKTNYSFCWIFFSEEKLYLVAYSPLLIAITLTGYTLLKIRKLMLERASEDVELRNRFMRIFRKLVAFPLVTFICWLPIIFYWILSLLNPPSTNHTAESQRYPELNIIMHIIFPGFVFIQSAVAYCSNDKIKSEVLVLYKSFCCCCFSFFNKNNRRNSSIRDSNGIRGTSTADRLETPFLGVEEGGNDRRESSFGEEDDDAIHFDDGSITFFGKEDSTDDER